jgi:hypothetical protein
MTAQQYAGGCACGAVRYETSGEPIFQNHCQCLDCRKRSGTGHSSYVTFANRAGVKITGEAKNWAVVADSGNTKLQAFCPSCGTPLYVTFTAMPDIIAICAASLDDPTRFAPHAVTYAVRALDWDTLDPSLQKFERMPG